MPRHFQPRRQKRLWIAALSLCTVGIAHAGLALADGIATPGMATVSAADAACVSTAANQAFPFASARRIVTAITTGGVTAMATDATVDNKNRSGRKSRFNFGHGHVRQSHQPFA
jgi:hypothetical protein